VTYILASLSNVVTALANERLVLNSNQSNRRIFQKDFFQKDFRTNDVIRDVITLTVIFELMTFRTKSVLN
jgi:hypothetical protein